MEHRPHPHTVTGPPARRGAAHAARPAPAPRRLVAGVIGAAMALAALGLGSAAWLTTRAPSTSTPTSAQSMTVPPPAGSTEGDRVPGP